MFNPDYRLVLSLLLAVASFLLGPAKVQAQQCTTYVAAKCSLTGFPNAYQWATKGYLAGKGYRQVATPLVGAIVVFQPGVRGTDAKNGHVALVEYAWGPDAKLTMYYYFRGALQGPSNVVPYPLYFTDAGCTNVSVRSSSILRGEQGISFWVK